MENLTVGIQLIAKERNHQIDKHGFTAEHHVNHPEWYNSNQLQSGAILLLLKEIEGTILQAYPKNWDAEIFQDFLVRDVKERLIIAGALIAAELDRLDALESICYLKCTSCEKEFDMDKMHEDSGGDYFCAECWKTLAPTMKAEYEELKAKGEIE
ncbi:MULTISPECIES: hypothetical protein [unclassified Chryseobacterium]|uniref:hypothetical protein n=1 Tax=unclassified Chryseobacterium TaxID=2593645 RepID=UPI003017E41B